MALGGVLTNRSRARRCISGERLLVVASALLLVLSSGLPSAADAPRDGLGVVVVDAGHGGDDEGARGPAGGLEKVVVLEVARGLAEALRGRGLRVVMTRERDVFVSLEERTHIANDPRMMEAARTITVTGDMLHYTMLMKTTEFPRLVIHLEATLERQK